MHAELEKIEQKVGVLFQELKTNVLDVFGEATWEFLINDELGVPLDENGNYHVTQDQDDSSFIR